MEYYLRLLVVNSGEEARSTNGFHACIIPSVQAGLAGGQTVFILWARNEPLIAGGRIVLGERYKDYCKAISVTRNSVCETVPECAYGLEEFNFFILGSLYGEGGGLGGSAFRIAKRLTANSVSIRDILLISNEGLPSEYYSDADLYGIVSVNSVDIFSFVKREVLCLMDLPAYLPAAGRPEEKAAEEIICAPEPGEDIPALRKTANGRGRLQEEKSGIAGIALFLVMCLIAAALMRHGMNPGKNMPAAPPQGNKNFTLPLQEGRAGSVRENGTPQTPIVKPKPRVPAEKKYSPPEKRRETVPRFALHLGGETGLRDDFPYRRSFAPPRDEL